MSAEFYSFIPKLSIFTADNNRAYLSRFLNIGNSLRVHHQADISLGFGGIGVYQRIEHRNQGRFLHLKLPLRPPVSGVVQDDKNIQILSGLEEGQEIISGPYSLVSKRLVNGEKVKVKEEERAEESDS